MTFTDLFSGHAPLYAASRPTYPERLLGEIADRAPGRRLAWDAGTGNGQAARQLASLFDHVHATDASAAQIAAAEPHARVTFAVEPAESASLPDSSCDLVLAAQAMHWFDHPVFFAEARRVLRPGGMLAAIGYGWWYVDPEIDAVMAPLLKAVEPHWLPGNWLLMDGYRDLAMPGEEIRLPPVAIHLAWERAELEAYILSWSVVQRLGTEITNATFTALRAAWPDGQLRHVTMPIVSRAARL